MSCRGLNLVSKSQKVFFLMLMAMFSLFSSAAAVAQTTVSLTALNFGNVAVGTTSVTHSIGFKNTGASAVSISSLAVTAGGPYALATAPTSPCPSSGSLNAGATCYIGLTLSPTTLGAQPTGTLTSRAVPRAVRRQPR